ncbi:MAG: hypothetical protein EOO01_23700 [Chitinophagaceae bacterium]|nr:MAG: hypothetical protein EOO01_23700 [Chitinophagaceae bacterium]
MMVKALIFCSEMHGMLLTASCLAIEVKSISILELFKGKTVGSLFMYDYAEQLKKKGEFEKFRDDVHNLLPTFLGSNVQRVFKLEEIEEATAYYKQNSSKGKILLKPN